MSTIDPVPIPAPGTPWDDQITQAVIDNPPARVPFNAGAGHVSVVKKVNVSLAQAQDALTALENNTIRGDVVQTLTLRQQYQVRVNLGLVTILPVPPSPPALANYAASIPAASATCDHVTTRAQLDAWNAGSKQDVVIDASLSGGGAITVTKYARVYVSDPSYTCDFGWFFNKNGTVGTLEVHGLVLSITNVNNTAGSTNSAGNYNPDANNDQAGIKIDGTAFTNFVLQDITIDGSAARVIGHGILVRNKGKPLIERLYIQNCSLAPLKVEGYYTEAYTIGSFKNVDPNNCPIIHDLEYANCYLTASQTYISTGITGRGGADGRAECGPWFGIPVIVERVKGRGTGWAGMWFGSFARGSRARDLNIDDVLPAMGVTNRLNGGDAIYVEHFGEGIIISHFWFGPNCHSGIKGEYDNASNYNSLSPVPGIGTPGVLASRITNGVMECSDYGVMMEDAIDVYVGHVKFKNCSRAACLETLSSDALSAGQGYSLVLDEGSCDFSELGYSAEIYSHRPRPKPASAETQVASIGLTLSQVHLTLPGSVVIPGVTLYDANGAAISGYSNNQLEFVAWHPDVLGVTCAVPGVAQSGNEGAIQGISVGAGQVRVRAHNAFADVHLGVLAANNGQTLSSTQANDATVAGWTATGIALTNANREPGYDEWTSTAATWSLVFGTFALNTSQLYRFEAILKKFQSAALSVNLSLETGPGTIIAGTSAFGCTLESRVRTFVSSTFTPGVGANVYFCIRGTGTGVRLGMGMAWAVKN